MRAMPDDIYFKTDEHEERARALARRCRLDAEDERRALSVYHGMVDAIAETVVAHTLHDRAAAPPSQVFIAAYRHRYGVDLSAHATQADAESRLLAIAWQQCMHDPAIRAAVDARFGPLVADEPPTEPPFDSDEHEFASGSRPSHTDSHLIAAESDALGDGLDDALDDTIHHPLHAAADAQGISQRGTDPSESTHRAPTSCGFHAGGRRRTFCEQLLEEWSELSSGEQLWIECCPIERSEHPDADEGDDEARAFEERADFSAVAGEANWNQTDVKQVRRKSSIENPAVGWEYQGVKVERQGD